MDYYALLKFAHIVGFTVLGGGLFGVFVSEWRAHATNDARTFAEAARYTALFYDVLVLPGAFLIAVSGVTLVLNLELGFFEEPWLVAMWGLFAFEFVEGNTLTRVQFQRTLKRAPKALEAGELTNKIRRDARSPVGIVVHFLDLPFLAVMIYCGTFRPDNWRAVGVAILLAVAVALVLSVTVPRLHRRSGA